MPPGGRPALVTRRRVLRGLAAAAVAAPVALAAACSDGDSAAPTRDRNVQLAVFFWGADQRAELTTRALKLYESRHPGVTFTTTWQGNAGYFDKLSTQAAGGNAPDLFQIDDNYLSEYAERNILLDLTRYTDGGRLDLSKFPESLARYGQVEGRQVGVAAAENTPGLIYNRTLLRKLGMPEPTIGMTYPEYLAWATQVSKATNGAVAGTMDASADYKALWLWLRSRGKELYSGKQLGFTAADLTAWFTMWKDARAAKATPTPDIIHEANAGDVTKQLVATGKAATSFMWSNQLPELQKRTKDELAVASYPGDPKAHWARASMYWAGFRGTRHPDAVADVINFLVNDPEAGKILGTERGLPSNTAVRKTVQDSLTDDRMKLSVTFENEMTPRFGAAPVPPPKGHSKVRSGLITAAESVQYGRSSPQDAAERFVTEANAALAS